MDANMTTQFSSAPPSQSEFEEILGMKPSSTNNPAVSDIRDLACPSLTQPTLTLQDKQGCVQKQESARRLQQELVLNPVPVTPKAPPAVKDLTKSLIENNLKQISVSGTNVSSAARQMMMSGSNIPSSATWTLPLSVAPVTASPAQAWSSQSLRAPATLHHTPLHSPTTQLSFPAPQFQLTTNKVPMSILISQPTFQNSVMSSVKPAQSTKPLSSSEINDFLS